MKKRYYMMVLLMSVVTVGAMAKPRAMKDMMRVAQQELAQTHVGVAMAKAKKSVKLLDDRQTVAVFGYEDGGFVVMATDDMYPEVLGSSETRYNPNTDNENFRWWLDAMRKVAGGQARYRLVSRLREALRGNEMGPGQSLQRPVP